jgi:hypothetical protein
MPLFYFHVCKGDIRVYDREGVELPDVEAARAEALEDAREMMSEAVRGGLDISERRIEIESETGEIVVVPFASALTKET